MDSSYLTNPLVFLVQVALGLYTLLVMLRLVLQLVQADFYNPLSQFIVKATSPLLHPLRRVVPSFGALDTSALLLAWATKGLELLLVFWLSGQGLHLIQPLVWAIPELVNLVLNIFLVAIFIQAILSWVGPAGYNPAVNLIYSLTAPVIRPIQQRLPPMSGLDFSPMLAIVALFLLKMLLIPPLEGIARQLLL